MSDFFISLRYKEANRESIMLRAALEEKGFTAYICDPNPGDDMLSEIAHEIEESKLRIIMGSETYGQQTASTFSTYEELQTIMRLKKTENKDFFLVKMCDKFEEATTRMTIPSNISYVKWTPGASIPDTLIQSLLDKFRGTPSQPPASIPIAGAPVPTPDATYRQEPKGADNEGPHGAHARGGAGTAAQSNGVKRFKLALSGGRGLALENSDVDATHGRRAHMIRMATAAEAIEVEHAASGAIKVVAGHRCVGFSLDNWYGRAQKGNRQHFSNWEEHHAAKQWQVNADGTLSPKGARHLVLGWDKHALLVEQGDPKQLQFEALAPNNAAARVVAVAAPQLAPPPAVLTMQAPGKDTRISCQDMQGDWMCWNMWCGWACWTQTALDVDRHKRCGHICLFHIIPLPICEEWLRVGNTNSFHKKGDSRNVNHYKSAGCMHHPGPGCTCRYKKK